jgi:hypothetical protein
MVVEEIVVDLDSESNAPGAREGHFRAVNRQMPRARI